MMQEELSAHDEEGEVVGSPGQEEETGRIVKTRSGTWAIDYRVR